MKTSTSITRFFGTMALIAAVLFIAPSCGTEAEEDPQKDPTEQKDEDASILEQRNEFWKEWKDKCAPPTTKSDSSIFNTNGKNYDQFKADNPAVWQAMIDMYQTPADGEQFLPGVVNSGSTYPIEVNAYAGQKLYKIMPPEGKIVGSYSPYYITEMQLEQLKMHPADLEQKLGLPLQSCSGEYWIYSITSLTDDNLFFQSSVASTEQYAATTPNIVYYTPGGATQSLLINSNDQMKWKKATEPDEKYIPDTLPKIE
ncbi:MAG: hypothetical protein Crog4KO_18060 [Crocinitomicaceae bacterium]